MQIQRVKEERNIQHQIRRTKADYIGSNHLLKQVTEGKIGGTGTRGRRRTQLLDDLKGN